MVFAGFAIGAFSLVIGINGLAKVYSTVNIHTSNTQVCITCISIN